MSTSISAPSPSSRAQSSSIPPSPTLVGPGPPQSKESSLTIRENTEKLLVLVANQRAQAARSAHFEAANARASLTRAINELEAVRKERDECAQRAGEVDRLRVDCERKEREIEGMWREIMELRVKVGMGGEIKSLDMSTSGTSGVPAGYVPAGVEQQRGQKRKIVEEGEMVESEKEEEKEANVLRVRCSELQRENEKLRARAANLEQRVEILENLEASANLKIGSTANSDNLPDLNDAIETLKAHQSIFTGSGGVQVAKAN